MDRWMESEREREAERGNEGKRKDRQRKKEEGETNGDEKKELQLADIACGTVTGSHTALRAGEFSHSNL